MPTKPARSWFLNNCHPSDLRNPNSGFTFAEVLFAVAVLAIVAATVISLLLQMNTYAMVARLKTLAGTIALNQIELVYTDAPFSPPDEQVPVELTLGTQTAPVIIYDDPNSDTTVEGTMTTVVEDPGYWQNGFNLYLRKITVTSATVFATETTT